MQNIRIAQRFTDGEPQLLRMLSQCRISIRVVFQAPMRTLYQLLEKLRMVFPVLSIRGQ
jgi:DNA-binding HxlR family transcriptional regulator